MQAATVKDRARATGAVALSLVVLGACTTTTKAPPAPSSRIEIQEAVGFTITEEARLSSAAELDYDRALAALERGDYAEGIGLLEDIVAGAPELIAPRVDLGIAYHRDGSLDEAENMLELALDAAPSHPVAHNEIGIVYRKTGRFAEARASYEAALAVYPGYHYARRNLAILCDLYLADPDCAMQNYEAYMATVPSDDEVSMWMKDLRYRMDGGQ